MKILRVPSALHEVFGEETTALELGFVFLPAGLGVLALFAWTQPEWNELTWWKTALLFVLIFDILAGFIANLTRGTNAFYRARPRMRLIFIAIHIQPLVLALLAGGYFTVCAGVWLYTTGAALGVNALAGRAYPVQKPAAAAIVVLGLVGLMLAADGLPVLLFAALAFYLLKVVYSFAVDQYA